MKLPELTDTEVWTKFKDGDDDALSLIYSENSGKLYLYGLKITTNHSIIEDSIQNLFSDLVRTRKQLGDTDNVQFYLFKSFKRRLIRELQKEKKHDLTNPEEDYMFEITYSVEHEIILEEKSTAKMNLLNRALKELTPRQKEAIYLKFTEELEYDEIAEMLEMSIEACRNLIYRGIKSLKESFQGNKSLILFFSAKKK